MTNADACPVQTSPYTDAFVGFDAPKFPDGSVWFLGAAPDVGAAEQGATVFCGNTATVCQ